MKYCVGPSRRNIEVCQFSKRATSISCPYKLEKVSGPTFLASSDANGQVCTVNSSRKGDSATGTLLFSGRDNLLSLLGSRSASNRLPVCVALDPGRCFILATGCGNNDVAMFSRSGGKGLRHSAGVVHFTKGKPGGGERRRSRLRYIAFAPSNGFLLTASLKASYVCLFPVNGQPRTNGTRSLLSRSEMIHVRVSSNSKPQRVYFRPGNEFTCLVDRLSNGVAMFSCGRNGLRHLRAVIYSPFITRKGTSVRISSSNGFLCTSGRLGRSNVVICSVSSRGKALIRVKFRPANLCPQDFTVSPSNYCLTIIYESTGYVRVFREGQGAKLLGGAKGGVQLREPTFIGFLWVRRWARDGVGGLVAAVTYLVYYVICARTRGGSGVLDGGRRDVTTVDVCTTHNGRSDLGIVLTEKLSYKLAIDRRGRMLARLCTCYNFPHDVNTLIALVGLAGRHTTRNVGSRTKQRPSPMGDSSVFIINKRGRLGLFNHPTLKRILAFTPTLSRFLGTRLFNSVFDHSGLS